MNFVHSRGVKLAINFLRRVPGKFISLWFSVLSSEVLFQGKWTVLDEKSKGREGDEMKNEIWKFDGIWNGDCYRDWFDSEVEE